MAEKRISFMETMDDYDEERDTAFNRAVIITMVSIFSMGVYKAIDFVKDSPSIPKEPQETTIENKSENSENTFELN